MFSYKKVFLFFCVVQCHFWLPRWEIWSQHPKQVEKKFSFNQAADKIFFSSRWLEECLRSGNRVIVVNQSFVFAGHFLLFK